MLGHAQQRGSLVFDVGSFHPSANGMTLFRAREHVVRFRRSASIVGLELPYDDAVLVEAAAAVVRANHAVVEGLIRWSVFYSASEPDLVPASGDTHVLVALQALDEPPSAKPIRVRFFEDARKAAPDVLSPEAKAAAAYLGPLLAKRRAKSAGADEIVLLDQDGNIAEAPTANAFAVVGGALWTPPLRYVLPGITRATVISLASELGIAVREEPLPREAFLNADEAFLTSTSLPLAPIAQINDRELAAPGPITSKLRASLLEAQAQRAAWSTLVQNANASSK